MNCLFPAIFLFLSGIFSTSFTYLFLHFKTNTIFEEDCGLKKQSKNSNLLPSLIMTQPLSVLPDGKMNQKIAWIVTNLPLAFLFLFEKARSEFLGLDTSLCLEKLTAGFDKTAWRDLENSEPSWDNCRNERNDRKGLWARKSDGECTKVVYYLHVKKNGRKKLKLLMLIIFF